jgi:phosphate-selective porin OprO/OprP
VGSFGALFEYATSEQRVRRDLAAADLEQRAWQLQLSWALGGERNSFRGVAPRQPFRPGGPGRGAWLIAARVSAVEIDAAAFPVYADLARSASEAEVLSLGLSWNLVRGGRWMLDYDLTRFEGGAAAGDRPDERSLKTRFQVAF